jgi:hypothetical protein
MKCAMENQITNKEFVKISNIHNEKQHNQGLFIIVGDIKEKRNFISTTYCNLGSSSTLNNY